MVRYFVAPASAVRSIKVCPHSLGASCDASLTCSAMACVACVDKPRASAQSTSTFHFSTNAKASPFYGSNPVARHRARHIQPPRRPRPPVQPRKSPTRKRRASVAERLEQTIMGTAPAPEAPSPRRAGRTGVAARRRSFAKAIGAVPGAASVSGASGTSESVGSSLGSPARLPDVRDAVGFRPTAKAGDSEDSPALPTTDYAPYSPRTLELARKESAARKATFRRVRVALQPRCAAASGGG